MPEYHAPATESASSTAPLQAPSAINRAAVKKLALAASQQYGRPFTRVSGAFFDRADAHLKQFIFNEVNSQPGVGVTVK